MKNQLQAYNSTFRLSTDSLLPIELISEQESMSSGMEVALLRQNRCNRKAMRELDHLCISPLTFSKRSFHICSARDEWGQHGSTRKRKKICYNPETKSIHIEGGWESSRDQREGGVDVDGKSYKKRRYSLGRKSQIQNMTSKQLTRTSTFVKKLMSIPGIQQYQYQFQANNLILQTHRFFEHQELFKLQGKATDVITVFHYTTKEKLLDCLMPPEHSSESVSNGSQRITCTVNPYHLTSSGDIGIIMAVLRGTTARVGKKDLSALGLIPIDTAIRNKELYDWANVDLQPLYHDEMTLQSPAQCLPLFQFPTRIITQRGGPALEMVLNYQQDLQVLMDKFFNNNCSHQPEVPVLEEEIAPICTSPTLKASSSPCDLLGFNFKA